MRMRKLEKGQSVVLLGSSEVEGKIRKTTNKSATSPVVVQDVLVWCIEETWAQAKRNVPRWAVQGKRFARHEKGWANPPPIALTNQGVKDHFAEKDSQTLDELYGLHLETRLANVQLTRNQTRHPQVSKPNKEGDLLAAIRDKCAAFQVDWMGSASLEEEQERELAPEIEQEQEMERPPPMEPCRHTCHPDVLALFRTGVLREASPAFKSAFELYRGTTACTELEESAWSSRFLVTQDFTRTVEHSRGDKIDQFLRPVHWVASCREGGDVRLIVLSPFEANRALSFQKEWKDVVSLHVYSPRTSLHVDPLDKLDFCTIGQSDNMARRSELPKQLNLFAGQTFVESYEEYIELCAFLGLVSSASAEAIATTIDGFIEPANRNERNGKMDNCGFQRNPLVFLRKIIHMRRKGKIFDKSHLGRMLTGERLSEGHFQ